MQFAETLQKQTGVCVSVGLMKFRWNVWARTAVLRV